MATSLGARLRAWTPAQVGAAAIGLWWSVDGVLAFALSEGGRVSVLSISALVDGRHGLFHLITGLCGIAVCARAGAARVYMIAAGALYLAFAIAGFIAGSSAFGLISVDPLGSVVHAVEGAVALAAGLVSSPVRPGRERTA